MPYSLSFAPDVIKTMSKWKKSNPILFKKLSKILLDIMEHPREGIGHPEPLVGGGDTTYSRRISGKDRIIYDIDDNQIVVLVIDLGGHYSDK